MPNGELDRLAATCLLPSFDGLAAPDWIKRLVAEGLGGIVLFARNVATTDQVAALTAGLRAERRDTLVAIDEEGGDVGRLERASGRSYPGNAALGAIDDVSTTEAVAAAMAADLAEVGVVLDLAPVADVNTNPLNAVIGTRSFGADADLVARHTAAFVAGLEGGGVAACAKHFPGHGDTSLDSHLSLPSVELDGGALRDEPLRPFRAAIAAGVSAVMTAHVVARAIDDRPATVSAALVDGLLRRELGFDGLVITDALDMAAIAAGVGIAGGAVQALAAGADAVCLGPTVEEEGVAGVRAAIVAAVRDGSLAEERLREAARRVVAIGRPRAVPRRSDRADGLAAARRALLVAGDVALAAPPLVVELEAELSLASDRPRQTLGDLLGGERMGLAEGDPIEIPPAERPLVVVIRDAHRSPWQRGVVEAVGSGAVVVETGLPYWRPPARGYVATYGVAGVNLTAAAERLLPGFAAPSTDRRLGPSQSAAAPP